MDFLYNTKLTNMSVILLQCNCVRCSDPTELGTFTSALICSKCSKGDDGATAAAKKGKILPVNLQLDEESEWKCETCDFKMSPSDVARTCAKVKFEGEALEANPSVEGYEKFVRKYSGKVLHPNHVLLLDKRYNLAKMYGRMSGYEADALTDEQLKWKRQLCESVLKVLDKIMPGRIRKRGKSMH